MQQRYDRYYGRGSVCSGDDDDAVVMVTSSAATPCPWSDAGLSNWSRRLLCADAMTASIDASTSLNVVLSTPPDQSTHTHTRIRYDTIRDAILTCVRKPT